MVVLNFLIFSKYYWFHQYISIKFISFSFILFFLKQFTSLRLSSDNNSINCLFMDSMIFVALFFSKLYNNKCIIINR